MEDLRQLGLLVQFPTSYKSRIDDSLEIRLGCLASDRKQPVAWKRILYKVPLKVVCKIPVKDTLLYRDWTKRSLLIGISSKLGFEKVVRSLFCLILKVNFLPKGHKVRLKVELKADYHLYNIFHSCTWYDFSF